MNLIFLNRNKNRYKDFFVISFSYPPYLHKSPFENVTEKALCNKKEPLTEEVKKMAAEGNFGPGKGFEF